MNTKIHDVRMKKLNESMGWIYGPSPKNGNEYWVASEKGNIYIANAIESACGWTLLDVFEKHIDVVAYCSIKKPLFKI